jgi:hypothetical protein
MGNYEGFFSDYRDNEDDNEDHQLDEELTVNSDHDHDDDSDGDVTVATAPRPPTRPPRQLPFGITPSTTTIGATVWIEGRRRSTRLRGSLLENGIQRSARFLEFHSYGCSGVKKGTAAPGRLRLW